MKRFVSFVVAALIAVVLFAMPTHAADDCQTVMSQMNWLRNESYSVMENIEWTENYLQSEQYDPATEGWLVDALGWSIDYLTDLMNEYASVSEQAHAQHCY